MPAKPITAGLALLLAAALLAGPQARGSTVLPGQSTQHVECMALYALLRLAVPTYAHSAGARAAAVLQIYRREAPAESVAGADAAIHARMLSRGAEITIAKTDAEIEEVTDAFLADLRACDALYDFTPTPQLWVD